MKFALIAALAAATLPSRVVAQAAATMSVDDVVSALAVVVKDRAKAVAARTAKREIIGQICSAGKFEINSHPQVVLNIGGNDCRKAPNGCGDDAFFIDTCRLAIDRDVELTDPHLLKTLGRDVVNFAVRVAAHGSESNRVKVLGLPVIGAMVFGALAIRSDPQGSIDELVTLALDTADQIRPPDDDNAPLKQAAANPSFRAQVLRLDAALRRNFGEPTDCANAMAAMKEGAKQDPAPLLACAMAQMPSVAAKPPADTQSVAAEASACTTFLSLAPQRNALFKELFHSDEIDPSWFFGARSNGLCDGVPKARRDRCGQAYLALNLNTFLHKTICYRQLDDPRRQLRGLLAVYEQELRSDYQIFQARLDALFKNDPDKPIQFEDLITAFLGAPATATSGNSSLTAQLIKRRRIDRAASMSASIAEKSWLIDSTPSDLEFKNAAGAQFADGLRLVALAARAWLHDKTGLSSWRKQLSACLLDQKSSDFFDCSAFSAETRTQLTTPMQALRDKVLDFYDLPRLFIYRGVRTSLGDQAGELEKDLVNLMIEVTGVGADPGHDETPASVTRRMVKTIALLSRLLNTLANVLPPEDQVSALQLSAALQVCSDAFDLGVKKDWFGVALLAQDSLEQVSEVPKSVQNLLKFSRTLLSMFQAESVENAQAIFAAQLESLSSREERFKNSWTVDIAALVGGRGGRQGIENAAGKFDKDWMFGAFAPFGVQVATGVLGIDGLAGFQLYPLDLGSYLVADGTGAPTASAAVRFGGALYLRPCQYIPIVFGAGGDYRPEIGDEKAKWRGYGFLALELPLFVIY